MYVHAHIFFCDFWNPKAWALLLVPTYRRACYLEMHQPGRSEWVGRMEPMGQEIWAKMSVCLCCDFRVRQWHPLQGHLGRSQGSCERALGILPTFSAHKSHSEILRLASFKPYELNLQLLKMVACLWMRPYTPVWLLRDSAGAVDPATGCPGTLRPGSREDTAFPRYSRCLPFDESVVVLEIKGQ